MAADLSERLSALETTMGSIETVVDLPALRAQVADLEEQASAPDLWDDQERAQQVTSRLSFVQGEIRRVEALRSRLDEVVAWASEQGAPVWIYCGSGFRASIGASVLEAAGVDLVHVDDDFPNAEKAGLPIVTPEHGHRLGAAYAD